MPQPHFESEHYRNFSLFITFRSYGTWLAVTRGSVDRFHNVYGKPDCHPVDSD